MSKGGGFFGALTAVLGAVLMFIPGMQGIGANLIVAGLMTVATSVLIKSPAAAAADASAQSDPGVKSTLPLDTANKIPVIYGNAWVKGINIWRDVSADDKTAYYCVAFSEVPDAVSTNTLNQAYYNDCLVTLDAAGWVVHAVDPAGAEVVDYNNNIRIQYYGNGMPTNRSVFDNITWLRNPTNKMTDLSFAIITVKYNAAKQLYTLGTVQVNISNTLTDPGLAIGDYMANTRYGAGLKTQYIDYAKLSELSAYSAEQLPVTYMGSTIYRPRYQINGVVNTSQNALNNIEQLVASVGSQLLYDIQNGKFSLYIDRAMAPVFDFDSSTILGTLSIVTQELSSTPTAVQGTYPQGMLGNGTIDGVYKGGQNTVLAVLNTDQYPATSPTNQTNLSYQFVNNNVQAQRLIDLELNQNKLDLTVQFISTHHATGISAGEVITITSATEGWTLKKFRVLAVTENEDQSGVISINITAKEYADAIYTDLTILAYDPAPNTDIPNPRALANYTPDAPTAQAVVDEAIISFTIPTNLVVEKVDVYTRIAGSSDPYTWLQAILPSATNGLFTDGINTQALTIAGGSYDIKVIYSNSITISQFSPALLNFNWAPATATKTAYAINPPIVLMSASADGGNVTTGELVQTTLTFDGTPVPVWSGSGTQPVGTWWSNSIAATNGYTTSSITGNTTSNTIDFTVTGANLTNNTSTVTLSNNSYKVDSGGNVIVLPDVYVPITKILAGASTANRAPIPLGYASTTSDPTNYTNSQFTAAFSASRTNADPPIGVGILPVDGDTAQFIYVNGTTNPSVVVSYQNGVWVPAQGNIMSGDLIVSGTIRSTALYTNDVYTIDLQSTNANIGNAESEGYWLEANTGNARFAGNVSIGNNATVGANLSIGSGLSIGNGGSIGSSLTIAGNANIGANLTVADNARIGNNLTIGANASIGGNVTIGNVITLGALAANTVGSTQIAPGYIYTGSLNAGQITAGTLSGNVVIASTVTASAVDAGNIRAGNINANVIYTGTISGNQIIANTLTANALTTNFVYAKDIVGGNGVVGSYFGNGYWMDATLGDAYFGNLLVVDGTGIIRGNLSVDAGSTFYGNLTVGDVNAVLATDQPDFTILSEIRQTGWTSSVGHYPSGNIYTQGNITAVGNVYTENYFFGDGRYLTNLSVSSIAGVKSLLNYGETTGLAAVWTDGDIGTQVPSGQLTLQALRPELDYGVYGNFYANGGAAIQSYLGGNIIISSSNSLSGGVDNGNITIKSGALGRISLVGKTNFANSVTVGGDISAAGGISSSGFSAGPLNAIINGDTTIGGNTTVAGSLSVAGIIRGQTPPSDSANNQVATTLFVTNAVTTAGGYGNAQVAQYLPTYSGELSSVTGNMNLLTNISASGNVKATRGIFGTITVSSGYSLTGNLSATNISASGTVTGSSIIGTTISAVGSTVTTRTGTSISVSGNITGGNITATGTIRSGGTIFSNSNISVFGSVTAGSIFGTAISLTGDVKAFGGIQAQPATKTGTSPGIYGQIAWDSNYIYVCTGTNIWKRVALTAF